MTRKSLPVARYRREARIFISRGCGSGPRLPSSYTKLPLREQPGLLGLAQQLVKNFASHPKQTTETSTNEGALIVRSGVFQGRPPWTVRALMPIALARDR
eukprot:6178794-Pleurochrysis_carterae.AAC.1